MTPEWEGLAFRVRSGNSKRVISIHWVIPLEVTVLKGALIKGLF